MTEEGHFTLEAVVALAIASTLLLAVQWSESQAISRSRRARAMLEEALALEQQMACLPRLALAIRSTTPTPRQSPESPVRCDAIPLVAVPGAGMTLRAGTLSDPANRSTGKPLTVLALEFVE